ncbi:A24 family peptidase [Sneathiella chinensis]|uniref:Prepilin peptidase n=1 Tax=Sneathiella chinensis TaxID=349750 RepID=A0ABQ5U392_9PROT|nr:prepilin peptidase [Sneathiella chinensis]GLQ06662.1 prepilin peptidase [Sneathiella chinensis]
MPNILPVTVLAILATVSFYDLKDRRIPNLCLLALLVLFPVFIWQTANWENIGLHLLWGGGAFAALFPFFVLGGMGGGDVKLIAVLALWAGPKAGADFLLITALLGGGLSLIVLMPGVQNLVERVLAQGGMIHLMRCYPTPRSIPYGVPVAMGGGLALYQAWWQ